MDLTKKERLILSLQLRVLEKLYPEEEQDFAIQRRALEDGYALHYEWMTNQFSDELSVEQCREVLEILDMFRALTFSFARAEENNHELRNLRRQDIKFRGFDGNNETAHMGYVQYFILDLKRFQELVGEGGFDDFNSHQPMLDTYREMLGVWRQYENRFELSIEQIEKILRRAE